MFPSWTPSRSKAWLLGLVLCLPAARAAAAMDRRDFLAQVLAGNRALAAAQAADRSLALAALEPQAMLSPMFSATAQYLDDQAEPTNPFSPDRITIAQVEAAISQQLSWTGTRLQIGFKETNNSIRLPQGFLSPTHDPFNSVANGLTLGVSQPLLRDLGARGYRIAKRRADAASQSARLMNRYAAAALLFEAETTYVTLAGTRAVAQLLQESLERNRKILEWTRTKVEDNLADRVDLLQVQAAQKQVESGLNQVLSDEARAVESFNALRGREVGVPVEELAFPEIPERLPEARTERLDLQAAAQAVQGSDAAVDEVRERFNPDLTVFGSATATGTDFGKVAGEPADPSQAWGFDHPTYVVGVKLSSTLDWGLYRKVVTGASMAAGQGRDSLTQKRLKASQEWAALQGQWKAVKEQLQLARALELIQREKAEREKKRYRDGRTSNFQVLRFEEDYNQARIASLRLKMQAAILAAQAAFYNGGDLSW